MTGQSKRALSAVAERFLASDRDERPTLIGSSGRRMMLREVFVTWRVDRRVIVTAGGWMSASACEGERAGIYSHSG
jgi:hypothetical protein